MIFLSLTMIKLAIAINDKSNWDLGFKADLLQQVKQYDTLAETFSRLIELEPENWNHYFNKANALMALSRADEALSVYDQIEAGTGSNPELSIAKQRADRKRVV